MKFEDKIIYRVYLKRLDKLQERVPHIRKRKESSYYNMSAKT
jgi:hypothetical protein